MNRILIIIAVILVAAAAWFGLTRDNKTTTSPTTPTTQTTQTNKSTIKPTGENEISIQNFSFSPASLTVSKSKVVKWINQDSVPHTVTENDGKTGPSSSELAPGATYSFTFTEAGVFHYHCTLHTYMTGVVTVTE